MILGTGGSAIAGMPAPRVVFGPRSAARREHPCDPNADLARNGWALRGHQKRCVPTRSGATSPAGPPDRPGPENSGTDTTVKSSIWTTSTYRCADEENVIGLSTGSAMTSRTCTGRARHLGPADGLVHNKADNTVRAWFGKADLYLLAPPLRGYTTVVVTTIENAPHIQASGAPTFGVETLIFGVEGEGLLFDPDDVGGGWGIATHAQALAEAGYRIT